MRVFLSAVASIALLAVGGWWVLGDPGPIRLYDADLRRLAESEREAWCAGGVYVATNGGGDEALAAECRAGNSRNNKQDLAVVVPTFCRALTSLVDYDFCIEVMEGRRWWPTLNGQVSGAWNRAHSYPGGILRPVPSDGTDRGYERESPDREGFQR